MLDSSEAMELLNGDDLIDIVWAVLENDPHSVEAYHLAHELAQQRHDEGAWSSRPQDA